VPASIRFHCLLAIGLAGGMPLWAARERPGGDDPTVLSVEALLREGNLDGAVALLDSAIRTQPKGEPKALYHAMRGGLRGEQRDLAGAIEDLGLAIRLDPKLVVAWRDRATARTLRGELELAQTDFDMALRLDPEAPQTWAARASLQLQRGAWAAAIADASEALRLEPRATDALHVRGSARAQLGELTPALADFDALLLRYPRHVPALTARAQIYRRLGDLERALEDVNLAVLSDGSSAAAYTARATIRGALGDFHDAIADCSTALLIDRDDVDALTVRALLHVQNSTFAEARDDLETALKTPGADPAETRRHLAWVLAASPDFAVRDAARARELAHEAIERHDDRSPQAFDALAAAAAELGDFAAAIEHAETALAATDLRTPLELTARRERLELYRQQRVFRLPVADSEAPISTAVQRAEADLRRREYARARDTLDETLRHGATAPLRARTLLAWLLATCPDDSIRDGVRATQLAQQALAGGDPRPAALDALAAAQAETFDFPAALAAAARALDATDPDDSATVAQRRERLECYRNAGAWRAPAK
jgi:tetratricopeptide (TPR) repeat protein